MPPMYPMIGRTRAGRPVYPIAGGDGTTEDAGGTNAGGSGSQQGAAAGQGQAQSQGEGGQGEPGSAEERDPTKLLELVQKLRPFERGEKVASKVQKQIDDLTAKVSQFESEKLSDTERKDRRISELETEVSRLTTTVREGTIRSAFSAAAAKAGARYPDDVWRLVDLAEVTFDEATGSPKNLDELIGKIRSSRPDYFRVGGGMGNGDGGVRTPAGQGPDMNALIRQQAGRPT